MTSGPSLRRQLADRAVEVLGGSLTARRYYDESESTSIDVIVLDDSPSPPWMVCSTMSLHETPNLINGRDIRVELMMRGSASDDSLVNVVASAAFFVKKDQWAAAPGVVFEAQLSPYFEGIGTPHIMWTVPSHASELSTVELTDSMQVHWLEGIPIYESERQFLVENGYQALDRKLEDAEIFDLRRPPVA